jgi:toluene monooxygenase system protein D
MERTLNKSNQVQGTRNLVGPILRMADELDAVVEAIKEDNPNKEIEIIDRDAYVRVQADRYLRVTRTTIERHLGRPFPLYELETMLSSFAGRILTTSDEVSWRYDGKAVP